MTFTPDFLLQVIIAVFTSVGVYAGIKSDLAVTREKAEAAKVAADLAHKRIDQLFTKEN